MANMVEKNDSPAQSPWRERIEALIARVSAIASSAQSSTSGFHPPVLAVATVNVAVLAGPQIIDGVAVIAADRVLLANQTTPAQNGIWVVQAGAWTRPGDWATGSTRLAGETVTVADGGTTFPRFGSAWQVTTGAVVDAPGSIMILFPNVDKGTGVLDIALADRWIFPGAVATAVDTTVGAVAALNVTAATPGAGTGQANGTLTVDGTAGHSAAFVIQNF